SGNRITLDNSGVQDAARHAWLYTTAAGIYAFDTQRLPTCAPPTDTALAAGETSTVTITFSEAVTGLDIADFTVDNGVLSNLSSKIGRASCRDSLKTTSGTTR